MYELIQVLTAFIVMAIALTVSFLFWWPLIVYVLKYWGVY